MANLSPEIVESKFKEGEIDEKTATELLISYIENSENENGRVKSIEILSRLPLIDDNHYKFIEEVLIADSNIVIQGYAATILIRNFLERGLESIKWVIRQYRSPTLLSKVLNSLLKTAERMLREIIIEEFNVALSGQAHSVKSYFEPHLQGSIDEYREFFEGTPYESIPTDNLMEIFLGYKTLVFIGEYYDVFYNLGFDLEEGCVTRVRIEGRGTATWDRPSDIDGLINFPKLEELRLKMCGFKEIGTLPSFSKLKILELSECFISEINNLEGLSELESLSLGSNNIKEIKGLKGLKKLKELLLFENKISKIEGLNNLANLLYLNLSENQIGEIKGLDTLKALEWLYLDYNRIKEIKCLKKLQKLEILRLDGNEIRKITGIDNLVNLRELDLSNNRIQKIEGINRFIELRNLWLYNNKIEVLEGIKDLTSLEILSLDNNNISEVRDFEAIDPSVFIVLSNNNLPDTLIRTLKELKKKRKIRIDL